MTMVTTQDDPWMGTMTFTARYADGCVNNHATYEGTDESGMYDEDHEPFLPPGYTMEDDGSITMCPVSGSPYGGMGLLGGGLLGGGAELIWGMFGRSTDLGTAETFVETGEEITTTTVIVNEAEGTDTTVAEE